MTIGNGNLGIRGCHEEDYENQDRGFFVNGIYNKPFGSEVSELVNLPDVLKVNVKIDGEYFSLFTQEILNFERFLDLETGELKRLIKLRLKSGKEIVYETNRLVSQSENIIAQKIIIHSKSDSIKIELDSGIDAQMNNNGQQHLLEKEVRVYNNNKIEAAYETFESKQLISYRVLFNKEALFQSKNRQIIGKFISEVGSGNSFELEKIIFIGTEFGVEKDWSTLNHFNYYKNESEEYWKHYWNQQKIKIKGNRKSQEAINFALYHLNIMTPRNNNQISIGAKGLTGQGYKGHVFWDTEIFILPYFLHSSPQIARNLLEYRFNNIQGALDKSKQMGYKGALFPWESALTGQEETPEFAAINIRTGLRQKIASGEAEQHIVADIAFAVEDYYKTTGDTAFMEQYGFELIKVTSEFWLSRVTEVEGRFEIHNVIGPDEYTEYIDNNAYTNYMAYYNVSLAKKYNLGNKAFQEECRLFLDKLYLPQVTEELILPQDDSFLSKPTINLDKYKKKQGSQAILLDYSRAEVNEMQILKQADVIMLMYLCPDLFSKNIISANFDYYEQRTIHDSSLSKAIHAIETIRLGNIKKGFQLFEEATQIDLGDNPHSSDDGLHAAALASLWHIIVFGFSGIIKGEILEINPSLPLEWESLSFPFIWKGKRILITLTHEEILMTSDSDSEINVEILGKKWSLKICCV